MDKPKPFSTYREMIAILQARNLKVGESAIAVLKQENYYSLINGYKSFFLDPSSEEERYLDGTSFFDIYNLFVLDKSLRYAFFERILDVETTMKSIISYRASEFYKEETEFYLRPGTYTADAFHSTRVIRTLSELSKLRDSRSESIRHYRNKYGKVPFWVLVKDMSFGSLSYFYDLLGSKSLQDRIANDLHTMFYGQYKDQFFKKKLGINDVKRDLWVLTDFRNVCAHAERFYCHICTRIRVQPTKRADAAFLFRVIARYLPAPQLETLKETIAYIVNDTIKKQVMPPESMTAFLRQLGFEVEMDDQV